MQLNPPKEDEINRLFNPDTRRLLVKYWEFFIREKVKSFWNISYALVSRNKRISSHGVKHIDQWGRNKDDKTIRTIIHIPFVPANQRLDYHRQQLALMREKLWEPEFCQSWAASDSRIREDQASLNTSQSVKSPDWRIDCIIDRSKIHDRGRYIYIDVCMYIERDRERFIYMGK